MALPSTVTEAEFMAAVDEVTGKLTPKFGRLFGDGDDFRQQVAVWSLEAVKAFNPAVGPLGGLLYRNARNRCMNWLRDKITRADHPCARCHAGDWCGDGRPCDRYAKWAERNDRKARVYRAVPMGDHTVGLDLRLDPSPSAADRATACDLETLIDAKLPLELRATYLQMRDESVSVPIFKRKQVQRAVLKILTDAGIDVMGEKLEVESYGRKSCETQDKGNGDSATFIESCRKTSRGTCPVQRVEFPPGYGLDEQEDVLADGQDGVAEGTAEVPVGTEFGRSHQPSWTVTGEDDANEHRLLSSSPVLNPGEVFD